MKMSSKSRLMREHAPYEEQAEGQSYVPGC